MRGWYMLVGAINYVSSDRRWSVAVRLETCNILKKKLLEIWPAILEESPSTIEQKTPQAISSV